MAEKTILLTYIYKHCMHRLTAPLMANTTEDRISKGTHIHTHIPLVRVELAIHAHIQGYLRYTYVPKVVLAIHTHIQGYLGCTYVPKVVLAIGSNYIVEAAMC